MKIHDFSLTALLLTSSLGFSPLIQQEAEKPSRHIASRNGVPIISTTTTSTTSEAIEEISTSTVSEEIPAVSTSTVSEEIPTVSTSTVSEESLNIQTSTVSQEIPNTAAKSTHKKQEKKIPRKISREMAKEEGLPPSPPPFPQKEDFQRPRGPFFDERKEKQDQQSKISSKITQEKEGRKKKEESHRIELQKDGLRELKNSLCEHSKRLDQLSERLEELLKDKKRVVEHIDDSDDEEEDKENRGKRENQLLLSLLPSLMNSSNFFPQNSRGPSFSNMMGMNNSFSSPQSSSPFNGLGMGMDSNFMMLTQLLSQTNGLGQPLYSNRQQGGGITYAPTYNYNPNFSGFMGQSSATPYAGTSINPFSQGQQMMPSIPHYPRGNALQTTNNSSSSSLGFSMPSLRVGL